MVRTFRVFASVSTAHRDRAADLGAYPSIRDQNRWASDRLNYGERRLTWS
jgi:hypothetical protein